VIITCDSARWQPCTAQYTLLLADTQPDDWLGTLWPLLQEDNFIPAMTLWETLTFYADVTLPASDRSARRSRVKEVLAAMGLTAAGHTLVSGRYAAALLPPCAKLRSCLASVHSYAPIEPAMAWWTGVSATLIGFPRMQARYQLLDAQPIKAARPRAQMATLSRRFRMCAATSSAGGLIVFASA
jgi:hypothetical protein